jgi:hypothetical protein
MSIPLEATGISQANTQELGYYSDGLRARCTGSKGVCWTNSQVIVTGILFIMRQALLFWYQLR